MLKLHNQGLTIMLYQYPFTIPAENKTTAANDTKEKSDSEKPEKKASDTEETKEKQDGDGADKKTVEGSKDEKSKATDREAGSSEDVKPLELPTGDGKEKQEEAKTSGKTEDKQKKSEETKSEESKSSKDKDAQAHKEL